MSSIPGLPTPGSNVVIRITRVHLHPLCVLVEFWGKFCEEKTGDYDQLAQDIQSPGAIFKTLDGNPGDQCLAQFNDTWYRCRIVSRNGSKYSVFLIDKGMTYSATASNLAWGKKEYFQLPPEVEFCVLANVLPLSPENRWSAVALEYLKSLTGKSVTAQVQDVLVPHRTFVLHIPCISKQMYEMGFAKRLSPVTFQEYVLMSLKSHSGAESSTEIQPLSKERGEQLQKQELFLYPELPGGTVETVIVTEVTNPQRIFCQLNVFSQELKKLSKQITQSCEGRMSSCIIGPEMIGFPCAARGSDGRWFRSVLQQVLPTKKVVEVLNVDYGTKQFVQVENVRPLAAEFFRMPVVTYNCSLHGIIDKGVGWTTSQIDFLRSLLLHKRMIAKFEYQSISEGVYYVSLYGDDNTNVNNLFGSKENCLLECGKAVNDYYDQSAKYGSQYPFQQEGKMLAKERRLDPEILPAEELDLNTSHLVVVQYTSNPSEFWIQTENYRQKSAELLDSMCRLYQDSANKEVVRNPSHGLYCAAKAADGDFYRAAVTEISETKVKVFFVDYGNTEMVDRRDIRPLPAELKKLPQLALKCSLAGVRPKDGTWSHSASVFFTKAVADKVLKVLVKGRHIDSYVVQLTDPKAQGEQDVSALMCSSGFAERTERQRPTKGKSPLQTAIICPTLCTGTRLLDVSSNSKIALQSPGTVSLMSTKGAVPTFKEQMFPIGSVLDVGVSYIESPNDFWCQLVQNAGQLKSLMHEIQARYAGSEFQPNVEIGCVARHPDNGMWYRALVVHRHETTDVDVLFVDYGQTATVSIYDLRRIHPDFLTLNGQAFRCSLLNPTDPTSAVNEWSDEAKTKFQNFVETSVSNFVVLKCTIYAVMCSAQMIVYNIVDLETPFESICTSISNLATSMPLKKATGPSFRLDTYYYSTHNIKTGTEEQVTVTYVNNVSQFYCHLEKNTDVMRELRMKVNNLCQQLEKIKLPSVFGTLCFARYTDGEWYRAQIKTTKPSILVHFVDYGDTIEVQKSDLLPVPKEANDIMSVPVQAVVCGLSDVPANVPEQVNSWFDTTVTECKFRALIVAREPDGKMLVELYHGNTQINAKIKKMFQIEMQTGAPVVQQSRKMFEASASYAQQTWLKRPTDIENHKQASKNNHYSLQKHPLQMKLDRKLIDVTQHSAQKPVHYFCETGQKTKPGPLQLYKPPHQRQTCETMPNNSSDLVVSQQTPIRESNPFDTRQPESKSAGAKFQEESNAEKLPKISDLPSKQITPAMTAEVYISHFNSPLSFYIQHVTEEHEMVSLVEKLNDPEFSTKVCGLNDVHPGDLVQAEFDEDSSWYRALVKEIDGNSMAYIEFIDFGNTAAVPISKLGRLHKSFLQFPVYSTHCTLSDAVVLGEERAVDPEVISAFREDIGLSGEKVLTCHFIQKVGSVWEVRLEESGVVVVCKVPAGGQESIDKKRTAEEATVGIREVSENSEKSPMNSCSLVPPTPQQEFLVGQQLEVYITAVDDAQTFWCQSVNSEKLDQISLSVAEVGDKSVSTCIDPDTLFPGTLCIALFNDDQLWYRAEVIHKVGDELSVLFVDYGNKSPVKIADVREMPPPLRDIPPQAFLCGLEGFNEPCGLWESGAADELSLLTADKLLQLTVTKATMSEGKVKYVVEMESEGQVINEVMKNWWKCSRAEDTPDSGTLTNSMETQQDDSVISVCEDQLEDPDIQDVDSSAIVIDPHSNVREDEQDYPHTAAEDSNLACSPKRSECSEVSLPLEPPEQEHVSSEEHLLNMVYVRMISPRENLPCDSGIDETLLLDSKDEQDVSGSSSAMVENAKSAEEGSFGTDCLDSPLEENIGEVMDELESQTDEKEETLLSACVPDIRHFSHKPVANYERETAIPRGSSQSAVKMVPRKADPQETKDTYSDFTQQIKSLLLSHGHPAQRLCGQEGETGGGIPQEEGPRAPTPAQNDSVREEAASAHLQTDLGLREDTSTVPSPEKGDKAGDPSSNDEESLPADLCAVMEEPGSEHNTDVEGNMACEQAACAQAVTCCITSTPVDAGPDQNEDSNQVQTDSVEHPSGILGEGADVAENNQQPLIFALCEENVMTEEMASALDKEELSVLSSDSDSQANQGLSALVEGRIGLSDSCPGIAQKQTITISDLQKDAEPASEGCEQQADAAQHEEPKEKELDSSILSGETLSPFEESSEAQLSKITHLSLVISDVPPEVLPSEQQSEE